MSHPIVYVPPHSRAMHCLEEVEGLCQALAVMLQEPIAIVVAETAPLETAAREAGAWHLVDPADADL